MRVLCVWLCVCVHVCVGVFLRYDHLNVQLWFYGCCFCCRPCCESRLSVNQTVDLCGRITHTHPLSLTHTHAHSCSAVLKKDTADLILLNCIYDQLSGLAVCCSWLWQIPSTEKKENQFLVNDMNMHESKVTPPHLLRIIALLLYGNQVS